MPPYIEMYHICTTKVLHTHRVFLKIGHKVNVCICMFAYPYANTWYISLSCYYVNSLPCISFTTVVFFYTPIALYTPKWCVFLCFFTIFYKKSKKVKIFLKTYKKVLTNLLSKAYTTFSFSNQTK